MQSIYTHLRNLKIYLSFTLFCWRVQYMCTETAYRRGELNIKEVVCIRHNARKYVLPFPFECLVTTQ